VVGNAEMGAVSYTVSPVAGQTINIGSAVSLRVFGNGIAASNGASPYLGELRYLTLTPHGNTVSINSGGSVNTFVYGGAHYSVGLAAAATHNSATVNPGGSVTNDISGGHAFSRDASATATGNSVTINGGTIGRDIYGGYAASNSVAGTGTANGNIVIINGGTIGRNIYGGFAFAYNTSVSAIAKNNTVTIIVPPSLGINSVIAGGGGSGSSVDLQTGNKLNIHSTGISAGRVMNFEFINFFLPTGVTNGNTMITVNAAPTDLTGVNVNLDFDNPLLPPSLVVGAQITLIMVLPFAIVAGRKK
jgi:hypothetical protein